MIRRKRSGGGGCDLRRRRRRISRSDHVFKKVTITTIISPATSY